MKKWYWVGVAVLTVALGAAFLLQAGDLFAQEGPWGGGDRGPRAGMGRMPRMGGGVAMITLGSHLFITNGQTLYKVDPDKMKVVGTLELRQQGPGDDRPRDRGEGRKGW